MSKNGVLQKNYAKSVLPEVLWLNCLSWHCTDKLSIALYELKYAEILLEHSAKS